ncbi:MAG: ParB N-terminal domain-containing protein [Anaerolineales bacterium]|nr:ParB N-terminal domain-containing protein [Anaerolineales bacterium]
MAEFEEKKVSYKQLLLDPNNYRYQDNLNFVHADESRSHEESVQDRDYRRLRNEESLVQLKNSFLANGFIPVERLVVRHYTHTEDEKYLVLEGNRRLAALMWIAEDYKAGVSVSPHVLESLDSIPVIAVRVQDDPAFYESLMGVRHVSGIKEWGGYQRAKLVVALRDTHGLDTSEVADRLGMSAIEVNRRYRAFKALQQMQQDENYGIYAKPNMYALYYETVSIPIVREWLGWDEESSQFTNDTQLAQLYELITPSENEETGSQDPKITKSSQIRELRAILDIQEAKRVLIDPNRSFLDAITIAKREELSKSWKTQIAEAIASLQTIGAFDLQDFTDEDLEELNKLKNLTQKLLDLYEKVKS